jgi:hypothetical protein
MRSLYQLRIVTGPPQSEALHARSAGGPMGVNSLLACLPGVDCVLPTRVSNVDRPSFVKRYSKIRGPRGVHSWTAWHALVDGATFIGDNAIFT